MKSSEHIGFLVNRLAFILRQQMAAHLKEAGLDLTPEECVLLNKLSEKDGQMQTELAEGSIRDQTTVTRLIDKLEKKALVCRKQDTKDRRRVLATLTTLGRSKQKKLLPLMDKLLAEISAQAEPSELETTKHTLRKIIKGLLDKDNK